MDIKDLRFFRQVYEDGSISKASKQLFITSQGLSRIIRNLEAELEIRLFDRSANGMVPTEGGRYLYENCEPLLEQFDEIAVGIRQIRDRDHQLKIGFACGVLNVFPFEKLDAYREQYSHMMLQWEESSNLEVIQKVWQGNLDIGFAIGQITNQELWSQEIFSKKMNVIVYEGHRFFESSSLSVQDLREERLITLNEKFYSYHSLLQRCRDFGFTPNIVAKTMESQIIYQFCREKTGLGIDADIHGEKPILEGLHLVGLHDSIPWKISIIIRKDRTQEHTLRKMAELFIPHG